MMLTLRDRSAHKNAAAKVRTSKTRWTLSELNLWIVPATGKGPAGMPIASDRLKKVSF